MGELPFGIWKVLDASLQLVGRGAAWVVMRKAEHANECVAYAMIGGAVLGAVACGAAGFLFSDHSGAVAAGEGATVGCLLGACIGLVFGACVDTVEYTIEEVLRSLDPK